MLHSLIATRNDLKRTIMRLTVFLIILICCSTACKKSQVTPGLFGKWELRREYGGFSYRDSVYKSGNGTIYQFNSDSTYRHFIKGKLSDQGTFHIPRLNNPSGNFIIEIFFNNNQYGEPFNYTDTTITIGTAADDGIASDYQKISN